MTYHRNSTERKASRRFPLPSKPRTSWELWMASFRGPHLSVRILMEMTAICLAKRRCTKGQLQLGVMNGRSERSARRAIAWLREQGYIRVIRRGRRKTNKYLLSRWLFARITGRRVRVPADKQQDKQASLGLWRALSGLAVANGLPPPSRPEPKAPQSR